MVGLVFIVLLVLVAIFAPLIAPYSITERSQAFRASPSADHWFGTDAIGRDVFSRVVFGARVSLRIGILATVISLLIGVSLGAVAGFFGGWSRHGRSAASSTCSSPSPTSCWRWPSPRCSAAARTRSSSSSGSPGWLAIARIVRASFLSLKKLEYVEAARALGFRGRRIMFRHILPNALQPIIVYGTIAVGSVILAEAALSFLGVGPAGPHAGVGPDGRRRARALLSNAPHLLFFPGAAIFLTVLAFVFVGDGLRDALDPKLK